MGHSMASGLVRRAVGAMLQQGDTPKGFESADSCDDLRDDS